MSLFPITAARSLMGQPVLTHGWEVVVPDLPAAVSPYSQSLSLKARSTSIPGQTNQVYETSYGPFIYTHPGKKTYPRRLNIQFEETYVDPVTAALKMWNQLVLDEESGAGELEADLKASIWLRILGPDPEGAPAIAEAVHLYEAFPAGVIDSAMDYRADGQVFVSVEMAYNVWRWETWPF